MEVSSHALALKRVVDIPFRVAALTNITRDHLDFHETFEAYAAAKRTLFEVAAHAVLNADDEFGAKWAVQSFTPSTTYSLNDGADIVARDIDVRSDGSSFSVDGQTFALPLPGRFNISNALATLGVARTCGVADAVTARALAELPQVAGRMELIAQGGVSVVVDYAHTPDALRNALRTLRETTRGRLTVVFGAGGDRDRAKRPMMGEIAKRLADRVIVTSDNPRSEDPEAIIAEILVGSGSDVEHNADRREAIAQAIAGAEPADVVVIAGKGHEQGQEFEAGRKIPFDDVTVAREILRGAPVNAGAHPR
jgi:UDP-N-acetylmuramoyl-L-alanyl-D-glutamate--2,6-diaminopimelate ligase